MFFPSSVVGPESDDPFRQKEADSVFVMLLLSFIGGRQTCFAYSLMILSRVHVIAEVL